MTSVFSALVNALFIDSVVLGFYMLASFDNPKLSWKVLTPESASGMTAILAQFCVFPRVMDFQDVKGHMKDPCRWNVSMARARHFLSLHLSGECLASTDKVEHWANLNKVLAR